MKSLVLGVVLACCAPLVGALGVDRTECREGAQFIANAAQSRKNGATREFFLGKLEEDLVLISTCPLPCAGSRTANARRNSCARR